MTVLPQDEHELTCALAPESPILFYRARRLLGDWTRDAAARFRVGRVEDGCWSVLRTGDGWQAVRGAGGEAGVHGTARAAVARAVGGLLAEAGTGLNPQVFRMAGIIRPAPDDYTDWGPWFLTEDGERLRDESERGPRPGPEVPCVPLERLLDRGHGYFTLRRESAPERGGFVTVHQVFEMAACHRLPDGPGVPAETLPEGTVLDGYGPDDQVFLYDPDTPFHKRGLQGRADSYEHRFYEVRRPLLLHPAFPLEHTVLPLGRPTDDGRGYYLVDSVAALLRDGCLAETAALHEEATS
ncbi:glycohydrolase toxin TNT-related protein [Actinomadura violacea]|uniref:Glycohydrolase toxin TNT-related protein n=1 Tax=Actinomadura violacea TaxID=2819934 RepID=A0ABS3RV94_9ACTN|nr:glycohydrolase toxin TNT-related protein [Actinomadura violacea]MBO2460223.1 glycohydrolase toxin TNT-related protein [Actinomadura violacea]